ncbi:MAG TPA: hypothetical protein VGM27_24155 [Acidobacteriaceae bacterium]
MAYYRAFIQVVDTVVGFAVDQGGIAKCTFDTRVKSNHNASLLYANYRESHPEWKATLADEISFVCSQKNPRVQIADLFAREAMKHLDNQIGPKKGGPRRSWEALEETGKFILETYDRNYIKNMADDRNAKLPNFLCRVNEYRDWIRSKGRQDNVSNLFAFARLKNHDFTS